MFWFFSSFSRPIFTGFWVDSSFLPAFKKKKNVPLPSGLGDFWWEVWYNSNCFSPLGKVHLSLAALKNFCLWCSQVLTTMCLVWTSLGLCLGSLNFFLFDFTLSPYLQHMEVLKPKTESELRLQQCRILSNPLHWLGLNHSDPRGCRRILNPLHHGPTAAWQELLSFFNVNYYLLDDSDDSSIPGIVLGILFTLLLIPSTNLGVRYLLG